MSSVPPPPPGPSDADQPDQPVPDRPLPSEVPAPPAPPAPPAQPSSPPAPPAQPSSPPAQPSPPAPLASPAPPVPPAPGGYDPATYHAPAWSGPAGPPPSVPLNTYGPPQAGVNPYGPQPGQGYPQGPGQGGQVPSWGAPPPLKKRSRAALFSVLGVVVLAVLAVGAYLAFSAGGSADPLEAEVDESVEAYAQQVVVGNCIEEMPGNGQVDTVTVVPCDEDHEAQVISAKKFSKNADFPGAKDVKASAGEKCTVEAIDNEEVDVTLVELSVWAPSEDSWEQGDRLGLCIASLPDGLDVSLVD